MAAPLKLTHDIINKVCESLQDGMLPRFAAMKADISLRSYHRWRKKGKSLFEKRDKGKNPKDAEEDMKMQFYIKTEKALGAYDDTLSIEYAKHMPKSWQTIAWIRQHRFPNDYRKASTDSGERSDTKNVRSQWLPPDRDKIRSIQIHHATASSAKFAAHYTDSP